MNTHTTTNITEARVIDTLAHFWAQPLHTAKTRQLAQMREQVTTIMGSATRRNWHNAETAARDILDAIDTIAAERARQ